MYHRTIVFFFLYSVTFGPALLAQTADLPPPSTAAGSGTMDENYRKQVAKDLFLEGVVLFTEKKPEEAILKFRSAYQLLPSWRLLYNIGQCEASIREYGRAIDAFEKYLAGGGDEIDVARQDEVLAELDRLRRMVGFIVIDGPAGYEVFVDGKPQGSSPIISGIIVSIGQSHRVVIVDGTTQKEIKSFDVTVPGTETIHLQFEAPNPTGESPKSQTAPATLNPSSPSLSDSAPTKKPMGPGLFIASLSTTLVAGGITAALLGVVNARWQSAEQSFATDPWNYDDSQESAIHRLQIAGYITGGITVAALVTTIISIPLMRRHPKSPNPERLAVAAFGSQTGAGISVGRRF